MSRINQSSGSEWSGAPSSSLNTTPASARDERTTRSRRSGVSSLVDNLSVRSQPADSSQSRRSGTSAHSMAPSNRTALTRNTAETASVLSVASQMTAGSGTSNDSTASRGTLRAPPGSFGLGSHRSELSRAHLTSEEQEAIRSAAASNRFTIANDPSARLSRSVPQTLSDAGSRGSVLSRGMTSASGLRPSSASGRSEASSSRSTIKIGGKRYMAIESIPQGDRDTLLSIHDPVRALNLTDDSVFYRATEEKWIRDGSISGNPSSRSVITNHRAVTENPLHAAMERSGHQGWTLPYEPVTMSAHHLGQPVLNVMYGPEAERQARGYARRPGRKMIATTLGDFRRAGGGDVYFDGGALMNDGVNHALVVTLPKKKSVPVTTKD